MRWTTCTVESVRAELSAADPIVALAERLGYSFDDPALLEQALCHRSWCAENPGHEPNERLEFLGDAVLGLIVADHVFAEHPEQDEGWLSRARSSVVRASALGEMAADLGIGDALRLGKGEAASGGREKTSILADALEAVIGAVYLDGGWPAAHALVLGLIAPRIAELPGSRGDLDHKSMLQELATRQLQQNPYYDVHESGPEHNKTFAVAVYLSGQCWGEGTGRSKKQAEQMAAEVALDRLRTEMAEPTDGELPVVPSVPAVPDVAAVPTAPSDGSATAPLGGFAELVPTPPDESGEDHDA